MKYILSISAFYEPDNNTPSSRTYVVITEADTQDQAREKAHQLECDLMREDGEVMETSSNVAEYQENQLTLIATAWG